MADGSVIIDTELDQSGIRTGLSGMASTLTKGITGSIAAASAALVALGKDIVNTGMEYEAQLSRVQAIAGATEEELNQLNNLAKELGAETVFSATEAAEGMENLASAGFAVNEIIEAMPGLLDLAAISGGDVANASDVAASTLRAFALEAEDAGHVADVLAEAAARTNAEVTDMGYAMKYVAPMAHACGITLEETAAAIGIMADAGIKGSQAGTTLRGALSRLARPTEKMVEKMDELNISFYDAEGNMIPLKDQITVLQGAFEGLTQEERNNALVTLYGQNSLSGMLALIEAGPEKLDELTQSFVNADGSAKDMAETMMNNLKGATEDLSGSLETLGIDIYQSLAGSLTESVKEIDGWVAQLQSAFTSGGFEGLVNEFGNVLADVIDYISGMLPDLIMAGGSLVGSLVQGITDNADSLADAAVETLAIFINCFITILSEVVELGAELLIALCDGVTNNISSCIIVATNASVAILDTIVKFLPRFISAGAEVITTLVNGIIASSPQLVHAIGPMMFSLISAIRELLPELIGSTTSLILGLVEALPGILSVLIDFIPVIIELIVVTLNENLPILLGAVVFIVESIVTALPEIITLILDCLPSIISSIFTLLIEQAPALIDAVTQIVTSLVTALPSVVVMILEILPSLIEQIVSGVAELLPLFIECVMNFIDELIIMLPDIINSIITELPLIINGIVEALLELLPLMINCGIELFTSLVQALPDIVYLIALVLPTLISEIIATLIGLIPLLIECGIELFTSLIAGIDEIIITIIAVMPMIVAKIVEAFLEKLPLIIECGIDLLTALIQAMPEIIVAITACMPTIISSIINALLDNLSLIIQCGIDLLVALITALPEAIATIVGCAPQIISAIVQAFINLKGEFKTTGKQLLEGIGDGISSAIAGLVTKAKAAAQELLDEVCEFFGIHSPSRVFKELIGENLMFGLAEGILSEAATAVLATKKAAEDISDVSFEIPEPEFPDYDGIDFDALVGTAKIAVDRNNSDIGEKVSAGSTATLYRHGDDSSKHENEKEKSPSKPEYVQNDIYIDGKKTARIITPYVSKELDWEDK